MVRFCFTYVVWPLIYKCNVYKINIKIKEKNIIGGKNGDISVIPALKKGDGYPCLH